MLRFRIRIVNQKDSYIKNETKTNRMKLSLSRDRKESQGVVQAACLPDADRWTNVLVLCKLSFSLPFSNGSVERMFSSLKVVKSDRRTRLHHDILTDLLEIRVESPLLRPFTQTSSRSLVERLQQYTQTQSESSQAVRSAKNHSDRCKHILCYRSRGRSWTAVFFTLWMGCLVQWHRLKWEWNHWRLNSITMISDTVSQLMCHVNNYIYAVHMFL